MLAALLNPSRAVAAEHITATNIAYSQIIVSVSYGSERRLIL
jgi:hypothetical protein